MGSGTPPTTPRLGIPRYDNGAADFAGQVNAVSDRVDIVAARFDSGLSSARPAASIAGRWYYATDTKQLSRDTGSAWEDPVPSAHASRHQDGGADPLTVREAMMATAGLGLAKGAFSATQGAVTTVAASAAPTKIPFATEQWDPAGWYDTATGRYQPPVPCVVRINAGVTFSGSIAAGTAISLRLYKKGTLEKILDQNVAAVTSTGYTLTGTAEAAADGSTDYFEIFATQGTGAAVNVDAGGPQTYFQGQMIGRS